MGVQCLVLERSAHGLYRLVLAVSGYGAYRILCPEAGIHVLELPRSDDAAPSRCKVRVRVVPQPDEPAGKDAGVLRSQAAAAFRAVRPERRSRL